MDGNTYLFCTVCQINHKEKRKHLFTKKHKLKLKAILQKYGSKVKLFRGYLDNPVIQENDAESSMKFWCYFCIKEVSLHVTDKQKTILYGGFFEHLANDEHYESTEKFWKNNGIENKLKSNYIISKVDLINYKRKLVPLVDKYNDKIQGKTLALAKKIKETENIQSISVYKEKVSNEIPKNISYKTVHNKFGIVQNPLGYHDSVRVWRGGIVKYPKDSQQLIANKYNMSKLNKANSQAGNGLTKIDLKLEANKGNIFNGATPPWLSNDTSEIVCSDVGPSIKVYEQYKKKKEKSKLNPKRVGANFNHSVQDFSIDWLPSFGRVWNDSARWKSRQQYRLEKNAKKRKVDD